MMQFSTLSLSVLAGLAASTPSIVPNHLESRDNCTTYSSVAAGTVCYHTPSDCSATYLVQSGDSCTSIAALYNNYTLSQFYYWNPDVGQTCLGLRAYVPVCINTQWYTFTPPVQPAEGTVEPASDIPVPIMPEITSDCKEFELAGSGYTVDAIVQQNNITLDDFLDWNVYLNKTAPYAWEGYWVCVAL